MNSIKGCSFYPSQLTIPPKSFLMHPKTITIHISIIHNKTFGQEIKTQTLYLGPKYKNTALQLVWLFKQNFSFFKNQINKLSHSPTQVNKTNIKLLGIAIQLTLTVHGNSSKRLFTRPTQTAENYHTQVTYLTISLDSSNRLCMDYSVLTTLQNQ